MIQTYLQHKVGPLVCVFLRICFHLMMLLLSKCFEVSTERRPPLLCIFRACHVHTPARFLSSISIIKYSKLFWSTSIQSCSMKNIKIQHQDESQRDSFHVFLILLTFVPKLTTPRRNQGSSWSLLGSINPVESTRLSNRGPPESP